MRLKAGLPGSDDGRRQQFDSHIRGMSHWFCFSNFLQHLMKTSSGFVSEFTSIPKAAPATESMAKQPQSLHIPLPTDPNCRKLDT